ncbi:MAG: hypothetical protein M0P12_01270 [Paludibacteraceae bacterium]|nr:hypothetical protein [Paludibacteraceae bacterium]
MKIITRKIDELKQRRNELACEIKSMRAGRKESLKKVSGFQCKLAYKSMESRLLHIAYCELMGRTRDEIEKPRLGNAPNEAMIEQIKEQYAWETQQGVQQ